MGCLSCQVVSIHYAKFLQQNINAAARLHSEHSDDAVCPCTPSLYLSMDPNITHHTDLKIHNPKSINQNLGRRRKSPS